MSEWAPLRIQQDNVRWISEWASWWRLHHRIDATPTPTKMSAWKDNEIQELLVIKIEVNAVNKNTGFLQWNIMLYIRYMSFRLHFPPRVQSSPDRSGHFPVAVNASDNLLLFFSYVESTFSWIDIWKLLWFLFFFPFFPTLPLFNLQFQQYLICLISLQGSHTLRHPHLHFFTWYECS